MEVKLLYIPNKKSFFRTCKPTGEPELKVKICLTGKENGRSLPWLQFEIVECGPSEFCNPAGSSGEMAARGYVLSPLLITYNSFKKKFFCTRWIPLKI